MRSVWAALHKIQGNMRILKLSITTVFIIMLIGSFAHIYGRKPVNIESDAYIEISFTGGLKTDTISLYLIREYSFNYLGREAIIAAADDKGIFRFKLHGLSKPGKIFVLLNNGYALINNYYIEPGDSVFFTYNRNEPGNPQFSGKGAAKFNCSLELKKVQEDGVNEMQNIPELRLRKQDPGVEYVEWICRRLDYVADRQLSVMNRYCDSMNRQMFDLFKADINAYRMERKYFNTWYTATKVNDSVRKEMSNLLKLLPLPSAYPVKDSIAAQSESYLAFLISKAKTEVYFRQGTTSLTALYQQLKDSLSGLLLDKAVTAYLLSNPDGMNGEFEMALKDALTFIANISSFDHITRLYSAVSKNAAAYPFDLPDPQGKRYKLNNLKDQLLIIDFWFNGCLGCITIAKDIENNVAPFFRKNEKVMFLSINVDNNRNTWLKALSSGKYTFPGAINLYTEGLAFDHPMIKFYKLQALPVLLIIKKGSIYAAHPVKDGKNLKNLIDSALGL